MVRKMSESRRWRRAVLVAAWLALPTVAPAQAQGALPGGASSLQETYGDWTVSCVQGEGPQCRLVQQQNQQNGQRVLAIELISANDGKSATGTLVLPFGLELDAGVTLQVDDKPAEAPRRFSTCLPAGCIVPLTFEGGSLAALRAGGTLKTTAKAVNSDQVITLPISLQGFSGAFDRVAALTR